MADSLGIYVSIPFCKAKCTFCNFASQAFPPSRMQAYVERLIQEIHSARALAEQQGMLLPHTADTVFFGGGTPSLLSPDQFRALLTALRSAFEIDNDAEITLEAAPGQIADDLLDTLLNEGVNRISLGVQSFVDVESRAVGRLHTGEQCLQELQRLTAAGVCNRNVDLIAGLPYQTAASWQVSLDAAARSGTEHVSVYMLEVDEDSTLGRELTGIRSVSQLAVLGQQARYSAAAAPSEEECADLYSQACAFLGERGITQYEISNFARSGYPSRHNRKYWTRAPYLGFGLDAHSMLPSSSEDGVLRFAQSDELSTYLEGASVPQIEQVTGLAAFEEEVFLGLRLSEGIDLSRLDQEYGRSLTEDLVQRARELQREGLMVREGQRLCLTTKGLIVSSSVFGELLATPA